MPVSKRSPHATKMGRPTQAEAIELHEGVLRAARRMFLDEGFERTSMESVGEAAGVTKRTLYRRYPDKSALLEAVLVWPETIPPFPRAVINASWTLERKLVTVSDALLTWILDEDLVRLGRLKIEVQGIIKDRVAHDERGQHFLELVLTSIRDVFRSCAPDMPAARIEFHTIAFLRLVAQPTYIEAVEGTRPSGYTARVKKETRQYIELFVNGWNGAAV